MNSLAAGVFYNTIKKEAVFQISRFIPIRIRKGACAGMWLYGSLFYNARDHNLTGEEYLYCNLDLQDRIVIEAGAHIGIHTMLFASKIGEGKILAFEPNPTNFSFLCRNIRINSLLNVIPVNAGLSNETSVLNFVSDRYNTGKGTFKPDKQRLIRASSNSLIEVPVSVATIDETVENYSLERVDFVKIDVEGFERQVIEGMQTTLERFKPAVYLEIHGLDAQQKQTELRIILDFLTEWNYGMWKLTKGMSEVTKRNIPEPVGGGYMACSRLSSNTKSLLPRLKS